MLGLSFTPTFNSLEVSRITTTQTKRVSTSSTYDARQYSDPVMKVYDGRMVTHQIRSEHLAAESEQEIIRVKLISRGVVGSDDIEVLLTSSEPTSGFHFIGGAREFSVIVSFESQQSSLKDTTLPGDVQVGDVVQSEGFVGQISGNPCGEVVPIEMITDGDAESKYVKVEHLVIKARKALVAFNTSTLPVLARIPAHVAKSLLLPRDQLGNWLIGLNGNYAYAASLGKDFVTQLLQHGLFVLPGDQQLFSCPFPIKPFVFKLQDLRQKRPHGNTWLSCKMLRRYGKEFELSCNNDFKEHLRRCGQYHAAKGGTWISDRLISLLHEIHMDTDNPIRVYAFELWDKQTGKLAAASFGLAIGAFFHDFSMCCLMKDRRSAGAILTKAIGALLTECGVLLWYWGCKVPYMTEYMKHGAEEISRLEYYTFLRRSMEQEMVSDPCGAISAGKSAISMKIPGDL